MKNGGATGKKMIKRPFSLIGLTCFICLFVFSGLSSLNLVWAALIASAIIAVFSLIERKRTQGSKALFAIAAAAAIACSASSMLFIVQTLTKYQPEVSLCGENISLKGKIISLPEETNGVYFYEIKISEYNGTPVKTKIRYRTSEKLYAEPYDEIEIEAKKLYPLGGEDTMDHTNWTTRGIYLGAYGQVTQITQTQNKPLHAYILNMQENIINKITSTLPGQEGAVLIGILLGNTSYINSSTYSNARIAGISHIFAVSGLHISIWSMLAFNLIRRTRFKRWLAALLPIALILFLLALTGFSPSASRAGIAMIIMLLGNAFSKEADPLNSLGLAMTILLAVNPLSARSVSLVLSFSAALGILVLAKPTEALVKRIEKAIKNFIIAKAFNYIATSFSTTISVILFTLPWMIWYFGAIPILSPIANLMTIPTASMAMILAGVGVLFSSAQFLFYPLMTIAGLMAKHIINVSGIIASIPAALVPVNKNMLIFSIVAACFTCLCIFIKKKDIKFSLKFSYILFAVVLAVSNVTVYLLPSKTATLTVCDAGSGLAVIVEQNRKTALIFCSDKNSAASAASFSLSAKNIFKLDSLIIPREQPAQSDAAKRLIENYSPKSIVAASEIENINNVYKTNNYQAEICDNIKIEYVNSYEFSAAKLSVNGVSILLCFLPASDFMLMPPEWSMCDILIARADAPESLNCSLYQYVIICNESPQGQEYDAGRILYTGNEGQIEISIGEDNGSDVIIPDNDSKFRLQIY